MQNYLESNGTFYHIFVESRLESILNLGTLPNNGRGVAVFRDFFNSNHTPELINMVLEYAIYDMLKTDENDILFYACKLTYEKHNLSQCKIIPDDSYRLTNPLHNYILGPIAKVTKCDIIFGFNASNYDIQWMNFLEEIFC